jgi:hypothetical protein
MTYSRKSSLLQRTTAGRYTLPAVILLSLLCRFIIALSLSTEEAWYDTWLNYLLVLIVGFSLIGLNNTFGIIRRRASVQTAIYLLLFAVCPPIQQLHRYDFTSLLYIPAIYFLFRSYRHAHPANYIALSFFFLGVGSLFFPKLTFFVIPFWMGALLFQALTLKSFIGSLLGWFLPYWILLGYGYLTGDLSLFTRPFEALVTFHLPTKGFEVWQIATLAYLFLLFLVSSVHAFATGYQDKIRTRNYLYFFMLLFAFPFLWILLQPVRFMQLLPLMLISISFPVGHWLILSNTRSTQVLFVAFGVALLMLFIFNLWILL